MKTTKANIALIGYRGSGKTTVGRILADRLDLQFVDTDQLLQKEAAATIADIFTQFGEAEFRRRESDAIQRVASDSGQVIALGGGAVVDHNNVRKLRDTCTTVWLRAKVEVLWQRIQADPSSARTRPALSDKPGIDEVRSILQARETIYKQCADHIINANNSAEFVVNEIIETLQ